MPIDFHPERIGEMSQYLQPWLFWSSSPSTSWAPKITAMLCETKDIGSLIKRSIPILFCLLALGLSSPQTRKLAFHDTITTIDQYSCISQIIGMCRQSRWHPLLSHRITLDSSHQSLFVNTVHCKSVSCVSTPGKLTTQFRSQRSAPH